jgi:hypothetical protein
MSFTPDAHITTPVRFIFPYVGQQRYLLPFKRCVVQYLFYFLTEFHLLLYFIFFGSNIIHIFLIFILYMY